MVVRARKRKSVGTDRPNESRSSPSGWPAYSSILGWIEERLKPVQFDDKRVDSGIDPIPISTFEELVEEYAQKLHLTQSMEDTLATMLAVVISVHFGGDPLWIYVVGPPSSGKSTFSEAISAAKKYCYAVSKMTGIVSGWKSGDGSNDASILGHLNGKAFVVKDFTTILSMPDTTQNSIYGELRDAYDGVFRVNYRNGVKREYGEGERFQFSMIAGCTDKIRTVDHSQLGERFLFCEILDDSHDDVSHVSAAFAGMLSTISGEARSDPRLAAVTVGYLNHCHAEIISASSPPEIPPKFRQKIMDLARLISIVRSTVSRDRSRDIEYRPRPEIGLRLTGQFIKLALSLCRVFGKSTVDADVYRIIKKIALDTLDTRGYKYAILMSLMKEKELTQAQLSNRVGIPTTSIGRRLEDLRELKIVESADKPNGHGIKGRKAHYFQLTKHINTLLVSALE